MGEHNTIEIDGHVIDLNKYSPDIFFSGKDGERVTDEEWDESARRVREAEASDEVTWTPVEEHDEE